MKLLPTPLEGLYEATTVPFGDERGQFARLFCAGELAVAHNSRPIVQINHSITARTGAIRGLHFQRPPHAEVKWVRCLRGRVWDVAVDLRAGSATFLRWHAVVLSAMDRNALFIPEGFAHGFQVQEPDSELLYLHTAAYNPASEGAVRWNDPRLAIAWPLPVTDLSERDRHHPLIEPAFKGIVI
jgi:dTDP-4-dehydrorhamnose 3,5-epimerase